jgi:hypothetical protein
MSARKAIAQQDAPPPDPQQEQQPYPQQGQPPYPQSDPQQQQQQGPQGPMQSPASVARVSFVQGGVQVLSGGQTDFQQAVMNMPLLQGSRLQTGGDGQAEIEFNDGSVARLTPNSSLQMQALTGNQVQLQQLSGLAYYELNVGQGHPSYSIQFADAEATATSNTIFRLSLDSVPEVAVMSGSVHLEGAQFPALDVSQSQTLRLAPENGAPYSVAQGVNPDSWDQWNQDRDQAISQEAAEQTPVRDSSGASENENWNDLDYYGNWYPVPDYGNVWVPSGVDVNWDPYGYGYWGFYGGFGYTWISAYPWGWLPYHCGGWNYFSFGWGWVPGRCGLGWAPVVFVRGYRGYYLPPHPIWRRGYGRPVERLVAVDRGPAARGPWGNRGPVPVADHRAALNYGGHVLSPVGRSTFQAAAFAGNRGTTPGVRAVFHNTLRPSYQQPPGGAGRASGFAGQPNRPVQTLNNQENRPPAVNTYHPPVQTYRPPDDNIRSTYAPRETPSPHYSAPPAPHYSTPPAPHYSAPPPAPHYSAPAGGGGHGPR